MVWGMALRLLLATHSECLYFRPDYRRSQVASVERDTHRPNRHPNHQSRDFHGHDKHYHAASPTLPNKPYHPSHQQQPRILTLTLLVLIIFTLANIISVILIILFIVHVITTKALVPTVITPMHNIEIALLISTINVIILVVLLFIIHLVLMKIVVTIFILINRMLDARYPLKYHGTRQLLQKTRHQVRTKTQ